MTQTAVCLQKVGRTKKEKTRNKEKNKRTNTHYQLSSFKLMPLRQLLASHAGNLHHVAKETKYKIQLISEYYVTLM